MRRPVDSYTTISQGFGVPAPGTAFGKHLGTDYAGAEGREVKAPCGGTIVKSYLSVLTGNTYELKEDGNGRLHRLMHLKTRPLGVGTHVNEGQGIALSGGAEGTVYSGTASRGPHVHWDVRKADTAWNAAFSNYIDPESLVVPPVASSPNAYLVGKKIQLIPVIDRTTFRAGTTTIAGVIHVINDNYVYTIRGIDAKYPNRVLINSASAGGDGVALALQYTNGVAIPGWKVL